MLFGAGGGGDSGTRSDFDFAVVVEVVEVVGLSECAASVLAPGSAYLELKREPLSKLARLEFASRSCSCCCCDRVSPSLLSLRAQ